MKVDPSPAGHGVGVFSAADEEDDVETAELVVVVVVMAAMLNEDVAMELLVLEVPWLDEAIELVEVPEDIPGIDEDVIKLLEVVEP